MRPRPAPISPEEYLRLEELNPFKSEYVDGEIYARSGAKRRHNVLATNLLYHGSMQPRHARVVRCSVRT